MHHVCVKFIKKKRGYCYFRSTLREHISEVCVCVCVCVSAPVFHAYLVVSVSRVFDIWLVYVGTTLVFRGQRDKFLA